MRATVAAAAPNAGAERLAALGVRAIKAEARFKDRRTLTAGETEIRARRFVLAPGSLPLLPALPGLDGIDHFTEDTLTGLSRLPGHLIVLGGGPQAIELAQSFRRLGSEVTVLAEAEALPGYDPGNGGRRAAPAAQRRRRPCWSTSRLSDATKKGRRRHSGSQGNSRPD